MQTYARVMECSNQVLLSSIQAHRAFTQAVSKSVISPLQFFCDNNYKNKKKLDDEIKKLRQELDAQQALLGDVMRKRSARKN
jgi:hypothetical protein